MLYSHASCSLVEKHHQPVLVFLHGLLGSGDDWFLTRERLLDYPSIAIDLPGHGLSAFSSCNNFKECCDQISDTLLTQVAPHRPIVLIGYSLGGRIAMSGVAHNYFSSLNIQQLIVEGGNFGLQSEVEKVARLNHDANWAERFSLEPVEQVLGDWYQQAVFSSLNHEQRQKLIAKRSANLGSQVAHMLMATSLGKQDYLLDALKSSSVVTHYICGEKDKKFSQLAEQSGLSFSQVVDAGHNVHVEQPDAFAAIVKTQVNAYLNSSH
tara:strand:+ start:755 stop:1552 length:798 start_codon:yes stop_codon:yes gene_type:complete